MNRYFKITHRMAAGQIAHGIAGKKKNESGLASHFP
jgi:hypothetical protein